MPPLDEPSDAWADWLTHWPAQGELGRRDFLAWAGASLALAGLLGCTKQPRESIVPYVKAPDAASRGKPVFYATALLREGYAMGVLAETHEGRPTKLEGNPRHPASLGGTDPFVQAAIWSLYDPNRSQTVVHAGRPSDWRSFIAAAGAMRAGPKTGGDGLAILTPPLSSPSLLARLDRFFAAYPRARWFTHAPSATGNGLAGSRLAWGQAAQPIYDFERARVIALLDADALYGGPDAIANAVRWARGRRAWRARGLPQRMYAWESAPTVTGTRADMRYAVRSAEVAGVAAALAAELGVPGAAAGAAPAPGWRAAARDLAAARGAGLVVAGERQPPWVHAWAARLNYALGNVGTTVSYVAPPVRRGQSIEALGDALRAGAVRQLVIAGVNPAYDAGPGFAAAMARAEMVVHLGVYRDETGAAATWHLPAAHPFEAWNDARAFDGTATIMQPLIAPLFDGRTLDDVLDLLEAGPNEGAYGRVRSYWQGAWGGDFAQRWPAALADGTAGPAAPPLPVTPAATPLAAAAPQAGLEVNFRLDPAVGDGSWAENAWLQELPRPVSKLTWGNAAWFSPTTARALGLADGDRVTLSLDGRALEAAALSVPGHADEAVTLFLGQGRRSDHPVAAGRGYDAYRLFAGNGAWFAAGGRATKTGGKWPLVSTQTHHRMEGRELAQTVAEGAPPLRPAPAPASLFTPPQSRGHAWAMVIDLDTCIGCGGCTVACQAENNIPVVGAAEVARGREMHWIRVDQYAVETPTGTAYVSQPVPCMHCEAAPCELVCPVGATVHDSEGLNEMVYNRCVGTRYCSNNCPYKVRRFNFFAYAQTPGELPKMQRNPEVSVRSRGVMEKCTYCIQRIEAARTAAGIAGRPLADGDVVTACQAACPTSAIVFGDLNDPHARVAALRRDGRHYVLLEELQTQPRTTYLAAARNAAEEG